MKKNILTISCILVLLTSSCIFSNGESTVYDSNQTSLTKVSVRLPIPVYEAASTPFFVAQKKGFYEDEGLDVTFELGSRELNPVKMVVSGTNTIGVLGGPDSVLVARSKNQAIKAIAVLHRNSNFPGLLTLKDSGITSIKQLEDKKVGFFYGHISTDVIRNMFNKGGVQVDEVDVGFDYSQLLTKNIDAQWAFRTTAGVNLPEKGVEINFLSPQDYGINTHGYTIFATDKTLQDKPEIIESFLRATFKGVQETLTHPEQSLESLISMDNSLDREVELKRLHLYNEVTSNSSQYPPGYMDFNMFQETYNRLREEDVIKNAFDIRDSFDGRFLELIFNSK